MMFYHNHRRYKSGKRQGKAPIELLTGEALDADWVALLIQHTQAASQGPSLTSSAPLALVPRTGYPFSPGHDVTSITYRESLMALPGQGQRIDLR
jgi:hypothetical protein